jgi:hypothetical protein
MAKRAWVYVGRRAASKPPPPGEKATITAACETFIAAVLKPRFLPEIRPSDHVSYPVAICGKWHGNKYRFITRYRSDRPDSVQGEFEAPFARLDYVSRDCLDLYWHRHTGQWLCMFERQSLQEAFESMLSLPHFAPC